jgi:uncharacterized linocin/CFP29 family protein
MDRLLRPLAPVTDAAWTEIETEVRRSLTHFLAARKVVDFTGPLGWEAAAVPTGRVEPVETPELPGVEVRRRQVLTLVELRTPFTLPRAELERIERGATDADLAPVLEAARRAAHAEDRLVFYGTADGLTTGIAGCSPHAPVELSDDYNRYASSVARAVATLKDAGVPGPYALALGPRCYRGVIETTEHGGFPLLEHLRLMLDGPVVWAPAVDGAVLISQRGGDLELICGQDLSLGYLDHDATDVRLYLEESITVRIASPEAAIRLVYPS